MKPGWAVAAALAALTLVIAGGWWWRTQRAGLQPWQGYVDGDFVRIGPPLAGRLTAVPVARGDAVAAGDLLFAQDDGLDQGARDEAASRLQEAEARLNNLRATGRPAEIQEAEAMQADAQAGAERAARDLDRAEALARTFAASVQQRDQARAEARSLQARAEAAGARLALLRSPTGRPQEIAAQTAVVAENRAQLVQAEWRLAQRRMLSPAAGVIADLSAYPGETLAAGTPVVSLLPPDNVVVRFFVAEPDLAALRLGETVGIACDSCPSGLTAPISFISPRAEFTPPVIYSEAARGKLVFLVEARPRNVEGAGLKTGLPVSVRRMPP